MPNNFIGNFGGGQWQQPPAQRPFTTMPTPAGGFGATTMPTPTGGGGFSTMPTPWNRLGGIGLPLGRYGRMGMQLAQGYHNALGQRPFGGTTMPTPAGGAGGGFTTMPTPAGGGYAAMPMMDSGIRGLDGADPFVGGGMAGGPVQSYAGGGDVAGYWTPERMAAARPGGMGVMPSGGFTTMPTPFRGYGVQPMPLRPGVAYG